MDKIRELFEEKELRSARLRVKWNGARYEPRDSSNQWHVDFACKVNLSLDMFKAGYEAAKASQWISVDTLAEIIRKVDGKHSLGAGALAEAILTEIGPTE